MKRYLTLLALVYFSVPTFVRAAEFQAEATITKAAQQIDTTVTNPVKTMWLTLPANTIEPAGKVRVKLAKITDSVYYNGEQQPISYVYRYTILGKRKFTLNRTVSFKLAYPSAYANTHKVIKVYNTKTKRWKKARNLDDIGSALTISGEVQKKHAILAVFEKPLSKQLSANIVQGLASWYDGNGAASNDFAIGSRIRTTNVATGAYVDSTVVSTGPFIPGRVVDLTREDFEKIASLGAGVVEVTVQQVE